MGRSQLYMTATGGNNLPFGILPRLLLARVCTEAVRTRSPELILGRSLSEFMRKLGMDDRGGGVHGERVRLRNQMQRLFGCAVTLTYTSDGGEQFVNALIADRGEYWWDLKQPDARALWESRIVLGARFFQEIITNPVPIDLHVLRAVKRSSLGLDLYLWLTYRTFTLTRPLPLKWSTLYEQLGADPARSNARRPVDSFRTKFDPELSNGPGRAGAQAVPPAHRACTVPAQGIGACFGREASTARVTDGAGETVESVREKRTWPSPWEWPAASTTTGCGL